MKKFLGVSGVVIAAAELIISLADFRIVYPIIVAFESMIDGNFGSNFMQFVGDIRKVDLFYFFVPYFNGAIAFLSLILLIFSLKGKKIVGYLDILPS